MIVISQNHFFKHKITHKLKIKIIKILKIVGKFAIKILNLRYYY